MSATTYLALFAWSLTACGPSTDTGTDTDTDTGAPIDREDGVAAARIEPQELTELSEASCVALSEAGDALADVDRAVSWQVDGAEVATSTTLTGESFSKGQSVTCTLASPSGSGAPVTSPEALVRNTAPAVGSAAVVPSALDATTDATCEGTGWTDVDDDPADYRVTWLVDGNEVSTASTLTRAQFARGQTVSCELTPWDGESAGEPVSSAEVVVSNAPPAVSSARLEPSSPTTTSAITVADLITEDLDGDTVSVTYAWTIDGAPASTDPELAAELFTRDQQVSVTLTPNDGTEDGAPLLLGPVTVANTPPSIVSVEVSPSPLTKQSEASCTHIGWADADDDPEQPLISWLVDGVAVSTSSVLTGEQFNKGQSISCELTPFDGTDSGTPVTAAEVIVENAAPSLSGGAITPAQVGATIDRTVVDLVTNDIDGDTVSLDYQWFLDGEPVSTDATLLSDFLLRGLAITVEVTPTDGETAGEPVVLGPVVVTNTAPEVVSAEILGTPARTNSVLELDVEGFDTDDDPLTPLITWLVDGSEVATSSTLDGAVHFSKGQAVSARVTVQDDAAISNAFTTEAVVIENTPPGAPEIVIAGNSPGAPLICTIEVPATDADDDPLDYTFDWIVDGAPFTNTTATTYSGDTVPAEAVAADQEWTCKVSASDGDDEGPDAIHSVTSGYGPWTLGTCGAEGQHGPSQADCDTAYANTPMADITVIEGKQFLTVPVSGTYRIQAWGAQGASAEPGRRGGRGARMRGEFSLNQGDELTIMVGQMGTVSSCNAGGGGGTFVARDHNPLLIAGGGGGVRTTARQNGCDANITQQAGTGSLQRNTHGCNLKSTSTIGSGGIISASSWGSGGGSIVENGDGDFGPLNGGRAFSNGGTGGGDSFYLAYGGFGGGGAGNGQCGGGGGGGFSGGDGGLIAGGGGSYNGGANQSNSAGAREGDGRVTIELL